MIKAIFIDIDGTLRDSNRNLSARTIETIRETTWDPQRSKKRHIKFEITAF